MFINPIAVKLGPIKIYWYGIMYLVGFFLAYVLGSKFIKKNKFIKISKKEFEDLIHYLAIAIIVGGRLGYVLIYELSNFLKNPINILYIWEGGMSFHGGFLGVLITILIYSKIYKKNFFIITDLISYLAPLGIGAGRIGNFINGELWGKPTSLPIGMIFPLSGDNISRHPSQIYEMLGEGLLLFFILSILSKKKYRPGILSTVFTLSYSIIRFLIEFLRDSPIIKFSYFNLTYGQLLSIIMFFFGIFIYFYSKKYEYL
ncbi:Prolipoprotein diacylglyceryl transferase [Candidatus Kinetoplastibacterium sorsogonicusi]|uniref:Phosphatidylglycerol--prolipoprotein diacylglyceryl transferase n=1 Tax=Candidatus Kinetoplastidibacterium kentomonadis TaxID=1576550 RepID=A0A3Q8ERL5_9PROT|nr:prolipoprotein diacylglyceryl transferase [Candidatus Kinetoplastibacterium sorsogonicusi]AWD32666.1 Prolipoprotein diacylglyceryl transferase [Candidatus Kinetoplastibacterium sorsogonicusi]